MDEPALPARPVDLDRHPAEAFRHEHREKTTPPGQLWVEELSLEQCLSGDDGHPGHPSFDLGKAPEGTVRHVGLRPRRELDVFAGHRLAHLQVDSGHDDILRLLAAGRHPGDSPIDEETRQQACH